MNYAKITVILIVVIAIITALVIISDKFLNKSRTNLVRDEDQVIKNSSMQTIKKVRPAAVAGAFYPASPDELNQVVEAFLTPKEPKTGKIRAIVAPHAGYVYSGEVGGKAFSHLGGRKYKTVWLLGPSHQESFSGVALADYTHWQTSLGEVKAADLIKKLSEEKNFEIRNSAHQNEHALEVELPFLQKTLGDFELVPMIFGNQNSLEQIKEIAAVLKNYYNDDTLIVVSCDFTHYGPNYGYVPFLEDSQEQIKEMDEQVISYLLNYQTDELYNYLETTAITNDGSQVLTWLSQFFKDSEIKGELAAYDTSGKITGDTTNSVSYVSLVFFGAIPEDLADQPLNQEEKDYLLKLARDTLNYFYETGKILEIDESRVVERLKVKQGVFVTLEKQGQLRGCIGYIEPIKSIYQSVIDNAISAAVNDHRFLPVTKDELDDIEIEISVLAVPKILNVPAAARLTALRPLLDGVVLRQGNRSSTYLPQVWEDLENPEEFLQSLCQKGGWPLTCWKDDTVELYTYQAEVFEEE